MAWLYVGRGAADGRVGVITWKGADGQASGNDGRGTGERHRTFGLRLSAISTGGVEVTGLLRVCAVSVLPEKTPLRGDML